MKKYTGLSFIEILLVLTVLAVLAFLSIPTIHHFQDRAQHTLCQSNLRQIGQAFHQYQAEHDGTIPPMSAMEDPMDPNNKNVWIAQRVLMPYTGVDTSGTLPTADDASAFYGPWICPADQDLRNKAKPASPRWKFSNSYHVNYYTGKSVVTATGEDQDARTVTRLAQIHYPNRIWYMADGFRADGGQGRMTSNMVSASIGLGNADGPRYRHGQQVNVLKIDSSVESFSPDQTIGRGNHFLVPEKN